MTEHPAPQQTAPAPRRRRRAWKIAWAALAIVVAGLGALVGYGLSERGLPFIVARVVAQSGGRISVEGPSGSLAGTMRFRRIAWRGPDTTVIADDVVVEWNPAALWSSRLSIAGLGARHLAISIKPAPGATPPPTDLALPLAVSIARTAVAEIDWRVGSRSGHLTGLEFGYDGDAASHRIHDLRFASRVGTLSGSIALAARAPLAVDGRLAFTGTDALDGAKLAVALGGTLPELDMKAKGTLRAVTLSLAATVTPFAESAFANAQAELADVDAAAFDAALPQTLAHVRVDAHPDGDAIAGDIDVANGMPGPLDRGRFPVDGIKARYAFDGETLALDDMSTTVEGGANARGSIRIALATAPASARFTLAVRNVDLARIDTRLATTRLSGSVISDADSARQTVDAEVTDRDLSLAFAAVVTASRVDLTRFRAQTGGGSLSGSAVLMRNDPGAFTLQATMHGLDPSRFAAMPKASIDASLKARGVLRPAWRADAELAVASGSRFDDLPVGGTAKATLSAQGLRGANVDLALASARLRAQGDLGRSGDRMTVALDAPKLADLSALLPTALPRPVAGDVHVEAALETGAAAASAAAITPTRSGQPSAVSTGPAAATTTVARLSRSLGGSVTLRASGLRAGSRYAVATLALRAAVAAPAGPSPVAWNERRLSLDVDATSIATSLRPLDSFHASAAGTLAQHHASIEAHGQDVDATATLDASLENVDHPALLAWRGTLASLANRGAVAFDLRGPASFSLARDRVRLAGVRVEAAQGRADVDEFSWDAGRITTRGAFTGVTLAKAAALAGRPLPFDSTLVLGGDCSIDAAPRLNGRFTLHRERGDIYAGPAPDATLQSGSQRRSLGITALDVAGTLRDDVLDAQAGFASTLAGRANATLHVGASGSAEPGTIGADAPLALDLRAEAMQSAVREGDGAMAAVLGLEDAVIRAVCAEAAQGEVL
ncbi:MAG TPA: hypothetical protein VLU54_00790, partial [Casimicrobiaceae bacterium]|nr:hypothetical protein [Casimicrobiaceae bacterium]